MKDKIFKIIVCIFALVFSGLSCAMGFGFMSSSEVAFLIRFLCGLCFMMSPLLVITLIILMFKKEK